MSDVVPIITAITGLITSIGGLITAVVVGIVLLSKRSTRGQKRRALELLDKDGDADDG